MTRHIPTSRSLRTSRSRESCSPEPWKRTNAGISDHIPCLLYTSVDATGDANLSRLAGAKLIWGNDGGHPQAATLTFRLSGVAADVDLSPAAVERAVVRAKAEGIRNLTREKGFILRMENSGIVHVPVSYTHLPGVRTYSFIVSIWAITMLTVLKVRCKCWTWHQQPISRSRTIPSAWKNASELQEPLCASRNCLFSTNPQTALIQQEWNKSVIY